MSISLRMLLTADGKQAKAEVAGVTAAVQKAGTASDGLSTKATKASVATTNLGRASATAANQVQLMSSAEARASASAGRVTSANKLAAGSVGNLAAQWNDLFVTIQSGQPSAQIALQQGSQIVQVIGPLGAAGAVNALKTAFVSLINPVSLATIGIIFAGSAIAQWALSAGDAEESTDKFTDSLAALAEQTQSNIDKLALLRSGADSIEELRVQEEINRLQAQRAELIERLLNASGDEEAFVAVRAATVRAELADLDRKLDALRASREELEREEAAQRRLISAYQTYASTRRQSEDQVRAKIAQQYGLYAETRVEAAALTEELLEAYGTARGISDVNMSVQIAAAANEAGRLASELGISLERALALANARRADDTNNNGLDALDPRNPKNERSSTFTGPFGRVSPFDPARLAREERARRQSANRAGGGGASAAEREAEAVQNLIDRYQQQLDVLRETDPVQKEMIRNRETLASASEGQRAKIEELITQHQEETSQLERKREVWDTLNSAAGNVLDSLFDKSKSLRDVLAETLISLLDVISQSNRLGGGGGGGLLGVLFPSLIPARANGGMVYGPGGPRDDKVMVAMSNGEMAINAKATARHRGLLEMINAGAPIPRLANGGYVGGASSGSIAAGAAQVIEFNATVNLEGARGDREIEEASRRGFEELLREFSREVLPGRVGEINADPRMVG